MVGWLNWPTILPDTSKYSFKKNSQFIHGFLLAFSQHEILE